MFIKLLLALENKSPSLPDIIFREDREKEEKEKRHEERKIRVLRKMERLIDKGVNVEKIQDLV